MTTPQLISHWMALIRRSGRPISSNQRTDAVFSCGSMVPPRPPF
jgi:hypothetical protein